MTAEHALIFVTVSIYDSSYTGTLLDWTIADVLDVFLHILPGFEEIGNDLISIPPASMQFRPQSGREPTIQFVVAL